MTNKHEKLDAPDAPSAQEVPQPPIAPSSQPVPANNNALAITSAVLGIVSLTGPGLILGVPAIIMGAIALKKKQGEKGLSITGLVTGIISTVISILIIIGLTLLVVWSISQPYPSDSHYKPSKPSPESTEKHTFEQNRT